MIKYRYLAVASSICLFTLSFVAVTSAFADGLVFQNGGGCQSVSISSGAATSTCPVFISGIDWTVKGSSTETGNLATGTSGVYVTVSNATPSIYGGGALSSYLQATYLFNGLGVSNGTAQFDITVSGVDERNRYFNFE